MENYSRVKPGQAWAMQIWVISWEEGCLSEKISRVKGAQAWAVQGSMISWMGREGTCIS